MRLHTHYFHVDKILDLIFNVYIPKFEANKLTYLLKFFKMCFSYSDPSLIAVISKLDQPIMRYYIVSALKSGKKDKVLEFFGVYGNDLVQRDETWSAWFSIPYLQNPHLDPRFCINFFEDWFRALHLTLRNFLSEMLNGTRTPALMKISAERDTVSSLKKEIKQLNVKLLQVQALLEEKEALLCASRTSAEVGRCASSTSCDTHVNSTSATEERGSVLGGDNAGGLQSCRSTDIHAEESTSSDSRQVSLDGSTVGSVPDGRTITYSGESETFSFYHFGCASCH